MSFLRGLATAASFIAGDSVWSSLARTAILAYAVNQMNTNTNKSNDTGTENIDQGVRLQAKPDATAHIPVLYGSAYFGGNISDAVMTNNNKTMWYSLVLAERTGTLYSSGAATAYTFDRVYWNNQRIVFQSDGITADYTVDSTGVVDRSISGLVKVYLYAGNSTSTSQQAPSGSTITAANAYDIFPNWTSTTHAMDNLIFAVVRVDYNREKGVTGIGDMLYQVTSSMTQPGDVFRDYITSTRYGAGVDSAAVSTTDVAALNSYSLDNISYDDQGTGAETLADRYQINGLIDTGNPVLQNAEAILSAAGSYLSYDTHTGQWGIVINRTGASTADFSDSNILGTVSISGTGLQELYNEVKVEFPHRELRDSADFYNISLNKRNSNEPTNVLNLRYDIINEPIQAQMLALIELKQARLDNIVKFSTDFSYYNLRAGDIITVTDSRLGLSSATYRIVNIGERQDNQGALQMDITAIQYDANIYSFADLYRFTRSDDDGIVTIGSIGTPGTPSVSKIEQDSRPRLEITSNSPTGVVEGLEYWLTTDVGEADDDLRSYTLIGTRRPEGGGVFTSGTAVTLEYTTSASDFYVKTRGVNTTTTGPFSAVSGLVEFEPVQTTQAIDSNTSMFDETGALLTGLALVNLASKLLDLFGVGNDDKSLFDQIFDTFEEETGTDLVGQATDGTLVVAGDLEVKDSGTSLGPTTASIDFTGGLTASGSSTITVQMKSGTGSKQILAWDDTAGEYRILDAAGCLSGCDFIEEPEPPTPAVPCSLTIANLLPASSGTSTESVCKLNPSVPYTGSYFITYSIDPGTAEGGAANPAIPFYAPIQAGIGNIYLYGSDGSLEQTLTESDLIIHNNVVELPFADRTPGKDYYILIEEGVVTSCSCENAAVEDCTTWSFYTSTSPQAEFTYTAGDLTDAETSDTVYAEVLTCDSISLAGTGICASTAELSLVFSENIQAGTGSVLIKDRLTGTTVRSLSIGSANIFEDTVDFGLVTGLSDNTEYDIVVPVGLVTTARISTVVTVCDVTVTYPPGPTLNNQLRTGGFKTDITLELVSVDLCYENSGLVSRRSNIKLTFNKAITAGATSEISVLEGSGFSSKTHQKIDLNATFAADGVCSLFSISGTDLYLNPTLAFRSGEQYQVYVPADAVQDSCGVGNTAITTDLFQVDRIETAPTTAPVYGSVYVDFEFRRPVIPGRGKIHIINSTTGELYTSISAGDPEVVFSETRFT